MIKIIWVIAVLLIGDQSFSQAKKPGWILAATTQAGANIFIKASFESKKGSIIQLKYKEVNEQLDSLTNLHSQLIYLVEIDCGSHKMKLDSAEYYDSTGKLIFHNAYDEAWEAVTRGSVNYFVLKKGCESFNR